MKKVFTLIAAAAMLAVSCQKETPATDSPGSSSTTGKLTATIAQTKVRYDENGSNLQPAWEVGDKIIGFDDAGNTYTFTVASVEAETATLSADKKIADGAYHLIYKSGAQASDISSKSLAIDYTAQAGDKTMPAVMLADGTVENGSCEFAFTNAGAIIGISAVKGVPQGSAISKITVEGSNLSAATVALSGSALALTAATAATDAITTVALSGISVTDASGTLSSPIFIAVPAGANIKKVIASVSARTPETMKIPSTAADKKDIDYVEIAAKYDGTNVTTKKWAKWNVGANSEKDYGWYFAWGGTEGYVYKNSEWVSASGVDLYSYTLSSAKTTVASDYLYVKNQNFAAVRHSFNVAHAPHYTRSSTPAGWTKYYTSQSTYWWSGTGAPDNKLVLDPEDDAARVNWGGSWRMPTNEDFTELAKQCFLEWTENYNSTGVKGVIVWKAKTNDAGWFKPSTAGKGSKIKDDGSGYSEAENHTFSNTYAIGTDPCVFFPAAGFGNSTRLDNAGFGGDYWSSSLYPDEAVFAYNLKFNSSSVGLHSSNSRWFGFSVRPVSD